MSPDTLDQIAMMIGRLHEQRNILMNDIERLLNSHQHGSECRPCREANCGRSQKFGGSSRSRLDAWRYLRDARRTGRDYRVIGRGPGTHRPDRGSGTNRDNARRSSKGGSEHRPLGACDTRCPDSELARSDKRPDVAIVRPFLCSMSDRVSHATVYLEL